MIKVEGLGHSYGRRQVLSDVSFQVEEGEIAVIIGSSGGGKTTLLKCLAGLIKPTEGSITIDGIDMVKEPERGRKLTGFVFQYAALFDYMDVAANIIFGVERRRRISRKESQQIVEDRLAEVGLEDAASLMPSELSGGMKKRVGMARALALEPKVIFYDEPTSGLDPLTAYSIDQLIVRTRDAHNMTSFVVSHDIVSVMRVADKILFLSKGNLAFFGTPEEFRRTQHPEITDLLLKAYAESIETA